MKYLGNGASDRAEKEWNLDPKGYISIYRPLLSKQNPKRPTKSEIAAKIQNGWQEITSGGYVKKIAKIQSNEVKSSIIA